MVSYLSYVSMGVCSTKRVGQGLGHTPCRVPDPLNVVPRIQRCLINIPSSPRPHNQLTWHDKRVMSKALFNTSGPAENLQWPIAERNVAREP